MKMFMPGEANREYATALAPPTLGINGTYEVAKTPTVIVRQNGEAWKTPFAAVYEPFYGTSSVTKVSSIKRTDGFSGLEVESTVNGKNIKQIILVTDTDNTVFNDVALNVELSGRFIVLSMDENDALTSIYMGKGSKIKYKGWEVTTKDGLASSFYVEIVAKNAKVTTNTELTYTYPSDITVTNYTGINGTTLSVETNNHTNPKEDFYFYKNKTSKMWNLETQNLELRNASLKIFNLLGETVLSKAIDSPLTEIDLSSITTGFYIVQMTNDNAIVDAKKIIIGM
jgi:hypothetical protein